MPPPLPAKRTDQYHEKTGGPNWGERMSVTWSKGEARLALSTPKEQRGGGKENGNYTHRGKPKRKGYLHFKATGGVWGKNESETERK